MKLIIYKQKSFTGVFLKIVILLVMVFYHSTAELINYDLGWLKVTHFAHVLFQVAAWPRAWRICSEAGGVHPLVDEGVPVHREPAAATDDPQPRLRQNGQDLSTMHSIDSYWLSV